MSQQGLPVSQLIDVSVNLNPKAAQYASVETLCIAGPTDVINVDERVREYGSIEEVGGDFSDSDPEYLAAELFFGQVPQPTQVFITRWAEAATAGLLIGNDLTQTQQLIATWQAIVAGGFSVAVDGGGVQHLTGLDFHLDANLNAVCTTINGVLAGAAISWDGDKFTITSNSTGAASSIGFVTAGVGMGVVDISTMLRLTQAVGAEQVNGIVAETPVQCLEILDNLTTPLYAFMFAAALTNDEYVACADFVESAGKPHLFGLTTDDPDAIDPESDADIGSVLQALDLNRTCFQYSANPYAVASLFGRMFSVDFNENSSTITAAYKQEPEVAPENLTTSQADALNNKNYIYYAQFQNSTMVIVNGTMASGVFFDDIQGADWLANRIQTDVYNLLYQTPTKIPQTDAGTHQIVNTIQASCNAGLNNGLIGEGNWQYQGFGQLTTGQFLPTGYYVYAAPIASQTQADRAARKAPPITVAVIFAGAIQSVKININVQR